MSRACVAYFICSFVLWQPCNQQYRGPDTGRRMTQKIKSLARELVADTEMKLAAIQLYRDQYYKSLVFQLGEIVYHIRNKYKRMLWLYMRVDRNVSYHYMVHEQNINTMLEVYHMGTEIENQILMVERFRRNRELRVDFHIRKQRILRTGREADNEHAHAQAQLNQQSERARGAPRPGGERAKRTNKKWQKNTYR